MNKLETREITVTDLQNDLMNGLSWAEKDNRGAGSIQDKYEATELQVQMLRKHPKLKDIEEIKFNFVVLDDTEKPVEAELIDTKEDNKED